MASSIAGKKKSQITKVQWNNFVDFATSAQKKYYETYGVIPDDYVEPTAAQTQALARGQYSAAYASLPQQGNSTTSNSLAGKTAKDLTRVEVYDFFNNATPEELDYYYGHHTNEKGEEVANGIPDSYVPKQNYTFWNAGNSTIGDYGIDDSNSDTWKRIQALYNSGDVNGAYDLINGMADKGQFGGYYDDNGQYWGFAQGYLGGANSSYLPVVGGKILSNKGLDTTGTTIWLTPDGKALHADANGALSDTGDTWSRYGNGDIARAQLKALDDADASLKAFREQNGGRYPEAPDPVPNGNGGLTYSYGGGNGGSTIYQQMLGQTGNSGGSNYSTGGSNYSSSGAGAYTPTQPQSYEQWSAQNGSKAAGLSAPEAYDPNSDTLYQQYLKDWANKQAPEYAGDPYQAKRDAALEAYGEKWGGSQYQPLRDQYLQNAANMKWDYNPDTDPVWQAYQKQYRREGQRATEDTLGRVAGMTGGMPSSYAVTAASQAGNYYASQLSDKLPQLYQDSYNRYLQEYQRQLGLSDAYAGFDNTEYQRWLQGQQQNLDLANAYNQYGQLDYQKYLDQLGQFNTDRNFAYGAARDNQALGRQSVEDQYKRYLDALSQANYEDETAYSRYRDTISDQRYDQEWAQQLREYADQQNWKATEWQQYLREYGDKLSQQERDWAMQQAQYADDKALAMAKLGAQYGDYSGLSGMGIDTSTANPKEVAYASDGSTYKFNTQDALYFVQNAPNGTAGNPTTMKGSDGSIWRKDEYGNVTITTQNGKVFTYNNNTPAVTGSAGKGTGYYYKGTGGGGDEGDKKSTSDYVQQMIDAGIKTYNGALSWMAMNTTLSDKKAEAVVQDLLERLGNNSGEQGEKHSLEYGDVVTSLDRMVKRGATWDEIKAEIEAEHRDGTISDAEYDQLREKYHSSTDNVENSGRFFDDGRPMSKWFINTMSSVSTAKANKGIEAARETLYALADKGLLHEYEIDIIMDELGLD